MCIDCFHCDCRCDTCEPYVEGLLWHYPIGPQTENSYRWNEVFRQIYEPVIQQELKHITAFKEAGNG